MQVLMLNNNFTVHNTLVRSHIQEINAIGQRSCRNKEGVVPFDGL